MCIIIDTNRLGDFFNSKHEDSKPIRKWLNNGGTLVYSDGGEFKRAMKSRWRTKLKIYSDSGSAKLIPYDKLREKEIELRESKRLKSDDSHILALAKAAGARLLYTNDHNLMKDFKNGMILNKPKGKVYSRKSNADLLHRSICKTPK